ncbi:MAG: VOC family protein [Micromonosporaceae bacterium]
MSDDPLDALRLPIVPVAPRPAFAAGLRRRIEDPQAAERRIEDRQAGEHRIGELRAAQAGAERVTGRAPTVRYFVDDLDSAVAFYCGLLGFEEELRSPPAFAMLYRGDLRLLLSVPGERGAGQALPDGSLPGPGGWNRIALHVGDVAAAAMELRERGARFRTGVVRGVTVKQVLLEDPSGNLIELFEPLAGYQERTSGTPG